MLTAGRRKDLTFSKAEHCSEDISTRETREWWPLLAYETEANGDSWSTYERGPSLAGSSGCFPHRKLFQFICPHRPASWAGTTAGSPVSYNVSLIAIVE